MTYVGSLSILRQVVNHHTLVFLTEYVSSFYNILKCNMFRTYVFLNRKAD